MKKFLRYIVLMFLIIIVIMVVFEKIYTYAYVNGSIQNKIMWVKKIKLDTLDYAVFGSSRTFHHINPVLINEKTGIKGVNLGYDACASFGINLTIKEYLKNNYAKNIFVQVDYYVDREKPDPIGEKAWIPYIRDKGIYNKFKEYDYKYTLFHKIPFYRYQFFESRIGFRYVVSRLIKEDIPYEKTLGYKPMVGELKKDIPFAKKYEKKRNKHIDEIIEICKERNIQLYFFTAPIYKYSSEFNFLKENLPNYTDFSSSITDIQYFFDHTHLNNSGADKFSLLFMEYYFKKTQ